MAKITAAEVNQLRKLTGAGMMDCKKALVEAESDIEKAIDILRKKGQKLAAKRADRDANEGIVLAKVADDKSFGAIIMLNCETDFVGKNQEFIDFANAIIAKAIELKPNTLDELNACDMGGHTVAEQVTEMVGKTGEKLQLAHYEMINAPMVCAYNHNGNRLGTILGLNKAEVEGLDQIGHEVAMQVAAMNPIAVDKDSVSQEVIDREMEIGKDQARQDGKPEAMIEKIAAGKLNKYFRENTLINQDFIRDGKVSVGEYLKKADKDLTVTGFKRVMLGA